MFTWIKKNKLATFLLLVIGYYFINNYFNYFGVSLLGSKGRTSTYLGGGGSSIAGGIALQAPLAETSKIALPNIYPPSQDFAPQPDIQNRLVIQESNISLLVKDVIEVRNKILNYADSMGGYMVSASTANPQDSPNATVVIRIPSAKLQESLDYFHSLSIKVVSENLAGRDVTDQYVDIDKHLQALERTKSRYEAILEQATTVQDITNVTREILNTQRQIDSYIGQKESLEKNAQLAKLTIYLATDEIALPYAPSETFRPAVIFKLAVRSLVKSLRSLATLAIWLGVYSVIIFPALALLMIFRKWYKKRSTPIKTP